MCKFSQIHINIMTGFFYYLHVYCLLNESQFMCIGNHLHEHLSVMSFRFVTIFMWICCHLHVYLSLVSFRFVLIFQWICPNLCVYLSLVSFIFVIIFILICTPLYEYFAIHKGRPLHEFLAKIQFHL